MLTLHDLFGCSTVAANRGIVGKEERARESEGESE